MDNNRYSGAWVEHRFSGAAGLEKQQALAAEVTNALPQALKRAYDPVDIL